jgi:uncharacterized membrane protein (UPF0136 family)
MSSATVVVTLLTIAFGVVVLGFWSAPTGQRGDRRSAVVVSGHVTGAAVSAFCVIAYLIARNDAVGAAAIVAVVTTIALGASSFASSHSRRAVPAAVLVIHGLFAAATLTLTIATVVRG